MPVYVRQSAKLTCTMGSARSAMQLSHPTAPVLLCGSPMAGIADNKTFANIAPLGLCKSLINPTVAAATAAAGGKLQEMPCVPNMLIPWLNGKPDVLVKGLPALTDGSKCVCMWGGVIEVQSAGQNSVVSGAAPTPPTIVKQQTRTAVAKAVAAAKTAVPQTAQAPQTPQTAQVPQTPQTAQTPQTPQGRGAHTPKKGLLVLVASAVAAAICGVFGWRRRGKNGDEKTAAARNIAPVSTKESTQTESQPTESTPDVPTPGQCFCNKDLGVDEFEKIVKCMRNADGRKNISLFTGKNCNLPSNDKAITRLTEEFNNACKKYGINTCIQKIHFISQIYWESARFDTTLEDVDGSKYNPTPHNDAQKMGNTEKDDGPRYKGRGLMQLTWRTSQMAYLKQAKNDFEQLKGRTNADIENRDNQFETLISDTLFGAMDSAGWFWSRYKTIEFEREENQKKYAEILHKPINEVALFADKYQERISIVVNGGSNGKDERKRYYDALKIIMEIDRCLNYAKTVGGQTAQNAGGADKAKQNAGGADKAKQNAAPIAKTAVTARLTRDYFGRRITLGKFVLFHEGEPIFECDACEDVVRGKGYGPDADAVKKWKIPAETAIPYGSYACIYTYDPKIPPKKQSKHAKRRLVNNVPGYIGIRIHSGKSDAWTEGCVLLGTRKKNLTGLEDSTDETITVFERHIENSCGKQPFVLEITDDKKPGVTHDEFMAELNKASSAGTKTSGGCFCKNKFTPDDLKRIIKGLRDLEKDVSGSLFCMDNCNIPRSEKNINRLTEEINKTCEQYKINTCIQKIHFLSQIYHGSDRFRTALEYAAGENYDPGANPEKAEELGNKESGDGPKYKGRGLIPLTGLTAQNRYLKSVKNKNEVLQNIGNAIKKKMTTGSIWDANSGILNDIKDKQNITDAIVNQKVDAIIDKRSNNYETIISDSLAACADSAGWYWSDWKKISLNINDIDGKTLNEAALFADKYQEAITKTINDGNDAKIKRKLYYDALKKIMNVSQCTSKSTYKGGLS